MNGVIFIYDILYMIDKYYNGLITTVFIIVKNGIAKRFDRNKFTQRLQCFINDRKISIK